jgi:predicted  nucleic acid-binding Zn-ribbon protein
MPDSQNRYSSGESAHKKRGMKMATSRYDILPSKDIQTVKKDLKDIKKKLTKKKSKVEKKKVYKVLSHRDIVGVKRDITEIKQTIDSKTKKEKTPREIIRVTKFDNYYDMLPHKRIKELEIEIKGLKQKLKAKKSKAAPKKGRHAVSASSAKLISSMQKLSTGINGLLQLFEKADELMRTEGTSPSSPAASPIPAMPGVVMPAHIDIEPLLDKFTEVNQRLDELSMENEEMAKGILVVAEMLKENPQGKNTNEPTVSEESKSENVDFSFGFTKPKPADHPSSPFSSFDQSYPSPPEPSGFGEPPKPGQFTKKKGPLF